MCIGGDYNCGFADNYYYTNYARELYLNLIYQYKIQILTRYIPVCIDHIAISENFAKIFSIVFTNGTQINYCPTIKV